MYKLDLTYTLYPYTLYVNNTTKKCILAKKTFSEVFFANVHSIFCY